MLSGRKGGEKKAPVSNNCADARAQGVIRWKALRRSIRDLDRGVELPVAEGDFRFNYVNTCRRMYRG
jgi:hypothetical protein